MSFPTYFLAILKSHGLPNTQKHHAKQQRYKSKQMSRISAPALSSCESLSLISAIAISTCGGISSIQRCDHYTPIRVDTNTLSRYRSTWTSLCERRAVDQHTRRHRSEYHALVSKDMRLHCKGLGKRDSRTSDVQYPRWR